MPSVSDAQGLIDEEAYRTFRDRVISMTPLRPEIYSARRCNGRPSRTTRTHVLSEIPRDRAQGPRPPRPRVATASALRVLQKMVEDYRSAAALLPFGPRSPTCTREDRRAVLRRVLAHDDGPISVLGVVLDGRLSSTVRVARRAGGAHTRPGGASWEGRSRSGLQEAVGAATRAWRATSFCAETSTTARPRLRATAAASRRRRTPRPRPPSGSATEASSRDCWMRSLTSPAQASGSWSWRSRSSCAGNGRRVLGGRRWRADLGTAPGTARRPSAPLDVVAASVDARSRRSASAFLVGRSPTRRRSSASRMWLLAFSLVRAQLRYPALRI